MNDLEGPLPKLGAWQGYSASQLQEIGDSACIANVALAIEKSSAPSIATFILRQIELATIALFPAWLEGAEGIETAGGAGREALTAMAKAAAASSDLFGPYLLAIADAALCRTPEMLVGQFASETVIRECHKLFRRAYCSNQVALILDLGPLVDNEASLAVQEAALWLSAQDAFLIWLCGTELRLLDRIPIQSKIDQLHSVHSPTRHTLPVLQISPLAGRPNPLSKTETRLETFLSRCSWAHGRAWNATWSSGTLGNPIRLDLLWEAERLVVELDGLDHLEPTKYANDRARDRALQFAGFTVLRFTNQEIADDISRIASEIERFLTEARSRRQE